MDDQVFMVTGASSGLGLALVSRLSALGRRVVAADLDNHRLEEAARRAAWPMSQVRLCPLDVRQPSHWASGFSLGARAFGKVDVLIHGAGPPFAAGEPGPGDSAEGAACGLRAAAQLERRGQVLLLTSLAALAPCAGPAADGARAVCALARLAGEELRARGLSLTVVYAAPAEADSEAEDARLAEAVLGRALHGRRRALALAPSAGALAWLLAPWPGLLALLWRRRSPGTAAKVEPAAARGRPVHSPR